MTPGRGKSRLKEAIRLFRGARREERMTPGQRSALRGDRLARLVQHARHHSPFYADRLRDLPERVDDPRWLPPVRKGELMASFDGWVTDPEVRLETLGPILDDPERVGERLLGRYRVMKTSGTTSEKAILLHDRREEAVLRALWRQRGLRRWTSMRDGIGFLRRGARVARVVAHGDHFPSMVFSDMLVGFGTTVRTVSVFDDLPGQVENLNAFDPTVIVGYPTSLDLLARERSAGRLSVDPLLMVSTGERLDPRARAGIQTAFGVSIRNAYAAAEHGALAFDCELGALHLNDDWAIVEPVDERFEPVDPGEQSAHVLLTNLANRIQPLLRYVLTDRVRLEPDRCGCGRSLPVIDVESRRRQVMWLRGRDGAWVAIPPIVLVGVLEMVEGLERYQVFQESRDRMVVRLEAREAESESGVWREFRRRLRSYFDRQGVGDVRIDRDPSPPRRDPRTGKYLMFWSEVSPPGDPSREPANGATTQSPPTTS